MALILLPNQLFNYTHISRFKELQLNKVKSKETNIYLIEHPLYFTAYNYHKFKLILHRASMKKFADRFRCHYINYDADYDFIFKKYKDIYLYNPNDHDIMNEFKKLAKKHETNLIVYESPNFICNIRELNEYVSEKKNPFIHKSFYIHFRKKFNILMDKNKPIGNKWSFDSENRNKFPDNFEEIYYPKKRRKDKYVDEAIKYVYKHFKNNPCIDGIDFYLPIDHNETLTYFNKFIEDRLESFGKYQDASSKNIVVGCHSLLSPLLNIGLIDPINVINLISLADVNIASKEGYIRQIFWREYVRFVYIYKFDELNQNILGNDRKLSKSWFTSDTEHITYMPNVDDCIHKFFKFGYLHHIERLMHVGNFMLLTDIDPDQVYKWFMMFIDAYPWAMAPNVYGMSQYSGGNMMTTRPYFSSSNYIKKMSNYKSDMFETWDALYYRFIHRHKKILAKNYATANAVKNWDKKSKDEQKELLMIANNYLTNNKKY